MAQVACRIMFALSRFGQLSKPIFKRRANIQQVARKHHAAR